MKLLAPAAMARVSVPLTRVSQVALHRPLMLPPRVRLTRAGTTGSGAGLGTVGVLGATGMLALGGVLSPPPPPQATNSVAAISTAKQRKPSDRENGAPDR